MTTEPTRDTYGTEISTQFVGKINDKEWPHFEWRVTLTRGDQKHTMPYSMGLAHVQTKCGKRIETHTRYRHRPCEHVRCQGDPVPTPPTLYDVLTGLKSDATEGRTFAEWCGDYGYDTDSRKAMTTYLACQESETASRRLFGADWERLLQDEDYT
jgi:hypothetical protein